MTRLWERYPSKTRWYCDGFLLSGPDRKFWLISILMMWVPAGLWYGFSMKYLVNHLTPAIAVISAVIMLVANVAFLITSFIDPGIIPRRLGEARVNNDNNQASKSLESLSYSVRGRRVASKYCQTCQIWRPPRATHCAVCDNCVVLYDHHCPWVGNCIGLRNYRYFLLFINSVTANVLYTLAFCIVEIVMRTCVDRDCSSSALGQALKDNPVALIIAVFLFAILHAIGGLSGFHYYLNFRNVTTNEELKGIYRGHRNPFRRGRLFYLLHSFFPPSFPKFLDPREIIDEDLDV